MSLIAPVKREKKGTGNRMVARHVLAGGVVAALVATYWGPRKTLFFLLDCYRRVRLGLLRLRGLNEETEAEQRVVSGEVLLCHILFLICNSSVPCSHNRKIQNNNNNNNNKI